LTADQVMLTLSDDVHPTGVVMVSADTRGAARAKKTPILENILTLLTRVVEFS